MNRIIVVNDIPTTLELDDTIDYQLSLKNDYFEVNSIKLNIKKNTSLILDYQIKQKTKLDIFIHVDDNVEFHLFEKKTGDEVKIQYKYYLDKNSATTVYKYNDVKSIKEMLILNLNGEHASMDYHLKTISKDKEKYDMTIYHNAKNTTSHIKNNGANIKDGKLNFNISSFVLKGKTGCSAFQISRIINETKNKCQINPNLFIDEYDVSANHSAYIGSFKEEEMFYLQSRGIPKQEAKKLLLIGFLKNDMPEQLLENIDASIKNYWR